MFKLNINKIILETAKVNRLFKTPQKWPNRCFCILFLNEISSVSPHVMN